VIQSTHHELDHELKIDVAESQTQVLVAFTGISIARDPAPFIDPILKDAAERAEKRSKELVVDFRSLDRMNSSSVSPILRLLHHAHGGKLRLTLTYAKLLKWQAMSFAALKIFETVDHRIAIVAA
jgi:hypothetical protein